MVKVLHAVEAFSGGIVQSVANICRALEGQVSFHILHGIRADSPRDAFERFPPSVNFTPWHTATRAINPAQDIRAIGELRAAVSKASPDVIHAHSSKAGALVRLAFPHGRIPIIYSPRGYAFLQQDRHPAGRATFWLMERMLGTLPHITVGCGLGEYSLARSLSRRAVLVPNMIDLAGCASAIKDTHRDWAAPLQVAMAGGIRPQKNFPLFCDIATALEGNSAISFLWIGAGEIPAGITLPRNLTITGWLDHHETLATLAACHIYLQTSLWEGLPLGLLEGMAVGLPVLAHPAVGNTELVVEGLNGHLCTEPMAFVRHLQDMDRDREALSRMGAESRRLVEQHHALERNAHRWLSLYRHYNRYHHHG